MFWLKFTPPYSLNTQQGWHTSDTRVFIWHFFYQQLCCNSMLFVEPKAIYMSPHFPKRCYFQSNCSVYISPHNVTFWQVRGSKVHRLLMIIQSQFVSTVPQVNILDCSAIYRYRQCIQTSVVLAGHPSFSASSHWSVTSQQSCLFTAHIKWLFRNHHSIYPHTPVTHLCQINELSLYTFQSHHQNARNNVTTV